jgi:hypothetical protein
VLRMSLELSWPISRPSFVHAGNGHSEPPR